MNGIRVVVLYRRRRALEMIVHFHVETTICIKWRSIQVRSKCVLLDLADVTLRKYLPSSPYD